MIIKWQAKQLNGLPLLNFFNSLNHFTVVTATNAIKEEKKIRFFESETELRHSKSERGRRRKKMGKERLKIVSIRGLRVCFRCDRRLLISIKALLSHLVLLLSR